MKNFKLTVKDQSGKILHEPEFDTLQEMQDMETAILDKNEWNFPTKEVGGKIVVDVTFTELDNTSLVEEQKGIDKNKARIEFGMKIMAELAYRNKKRLAAGLTTVAEIFSAEAKLATIQRYLLNSSTEKAYQDLSALDVPELPSSEKQYFLDKIHSYLVSEQ